MVKQLTEVQNQFGQLLRQAREQAGLSRSALAERVGLDVSYIYRIEVGGRCPSRETILGLAETLGVGAPEVDNWLLTAGYAPVPLLNSVLTAMSKRGGGRRLVGIPAESSPEEVGRRVSRVAELGLQEAAIGGLVRAMEKAGMSDRQIVAKAIRAVFARMTRSLETPLRSAVIPVAGGQHRFIAPHVMQRLALRVIREAVESGISSFTLVLAPDLIGTLFMPLKEALELALVPIKLRYTEQAKPEGLGDAVLNVEKFVGKEPFALLLPDDFVYERVNRTAHPRALHRMMEAFKQLDSGNVVAVISVKKSKMPNCGIAQLSPPQTIPNLHPITRLIEKPRLGDPVCGSPRSMGIVGRYILSPDIFPALRAVREEFKDSEGRLELTDALERLRREKQNVYAFKIQATRRDFGDVFIRASEMMGFVSGQTSTD